jgi:hypothetical protein
VDDLGEGCEAVCRARGVGDDVDVLGVLIFIHAQYEHGCVGRGSRNDDFFRATLEVCCGLFFGGENTLDKRGVYKDMGHKEEDGTHQT